jgi:competence protein ComEA
MIIIMKNGWAIAFGVVGGLIGSAVILLASSPPRGEAIHLLPPPTASPLVVHVSGGVVHQGVYQLPRGSRVQDAIASAGGLLPNADAQSLNLAALLKDGEKIWVPISSSSEEESQSETKVSSIPLQSTNQAFQANPALININTASQLELESLPGIGPALAQRIIAYRQEHGAFARTEDIVAVPGIGEATYERIKNLITVGK